MATGHVTTTVSEADERLVEESGLLGEVAAVPLSSPLQPEADAPTPGADEAADAVATVAAVEGPSRTEEDLRLEAELATLSGTRLFDASWYVKRYAEVARSGLSPALHYLQVGGPRRRRPGPLFDAEYYAGAGPALAARANPVLHYLAEGRRAGRPPSPLLDISQPEGRIPPESAGAAPDKLANEAPPGWSSAAEAARLPDAVSFDGAPLAPAAPDAALGPLEAFARLAGLDPAEAIVAPGRAPGAAGAATFGDIFLAGAAKLADVWHIDAATLRLRFGGFASRSGDAPRRVVCGYQVAFDGTGLRLCGEALLPAAGPGFVDLDLLEPLEPVLLTLSDPDGRIVDFALLPFPSLVRGGVHYAELIATAPGGDPVEGLRLHGERLLADMSEGPGAICKILIDPAGASAAEPIFGEAMLDWLARRFRVAVEVDEQDRIADPIRDHLRRALEQCEASAPAREGMTLRLPPDALPSLAALTARRLATPAGAPKTTGAFVVAAVPNGDPRILVTPPALDESFFAAPTHGVALDYPVLSGPEGGEGASPLLAIRRRRFVKAHDAETLRPIAPDAKRPIATSSASLVAIVFCGGTTEGVRLLESISRQKGVSLTRISVRLVGDAANREEIEHAATRLFGDRAEVGPSSGDFWRDVTEAAKDAGAAYLLVAKSGTVAPDPFTLACLTSLVGAEGVASASCLSIREDPTKRAGAIEPLCGGYFATPPRAAGDDALDLISPHSLWAFPSAAYPVVANALDFAVLRADAATAPDGPPDASANDREVAWGVRELLAGRRHVCTSAVRVVRYREDIGPPAVRLAVSAAERATIEANATVMREFAS